MMHITSDPTLPPTPKRGWRPRLSIAVAILALVAAFAAATAQATTKTRAHHYRSVIANEALSTGGGYQPFPERGWSSERTMSSFL